jgi:phage terminase large subunit
MTSPSKPDELLKVDIGYRPHRFQAEIHAKARRFTVAVTHRRFGKTFLSSAQLVDGALRTTKQDARFGYLAPFLKQAKQSAWGYLRQFSGPIPGSSVP